MTARLYGMSISHPARAARLMLEHKGIEYETVNVSPGMQALRVRLADFRDPAAAASRARSGWHRFLKGDEPGARPAHRSGRGWS